DGPRYQGRSRLDELLPPVPGRRRVRWLQDLGHRPREPPYDAGSLQPDEEPARQLQHQTARAVLGPVMPESIVLARIIATPAAREAIRLLRAARGGPVMFVQSGGCCAGSTPMCFPVGEFLVGDIDVLLGEIDGCPFYIDKRLDEAWHEEQFLLDVAPGEPEDFSLPAGDNLHFVTRSPHLRLASAPDESVLSSAPEWSTP